jgi:membrane-bound lytic murein transglycosylase D
MEGTGGVTTTSQSGGAMDASFTGIGGSSNPYETTAILTSEEKELSETQTISGKFNAAIIAKNLAMDIALFNKYNPQFDNLINTNGQFELILPAEKMQLFLATKYQILNECVQQLLTDTNIPNNKTVYPAKYGRSKKVNGQ